MPHIFISYRRDDTEDISARIADALQERFGEANVFIDSGIKGGEAWRERIDQALASCDVMLVIIGRSWSKVRSADGTQRLAEPGDVVAYEIEAALQRKLRLIPV